MKLLPLLFLFSSCASASPKLLEITDKASLDFIIEAVTYDGVASVQGQASYIMNFKIPENTVMFAVRTCHREKFFPTSKQTAIAYRYTPVNEIENTDKLCNLSATAITATGEKLWAYVNFVYPRNNDPKNMLSAYVFCDGLVSKQLGGAVCQARSETPPTPGSTQRIQLEGQAIYYKATSDKCSAPVLTDVLNTKFEINLSPGICTYLFGDINGATFRLITNGYIGRTF